MLYWFDFIIRYILTIYVDRSELRGGLKNVIVCLFLRCFRCGGSIYA